MFTNQWKTRANLTGQLKRRAFMGDRKSKKDKSKNDRQKANKLEQQKADQKNKQPKKSA